MRAHRFASSPCGKVTTSPTKRHLLVPGLGVLRLSMLAVPLLLLANPAFAQAIDKSKTFFIETDTAAQQDPMNLAGGTLKPTTATTFFQPVDITLPGSIIDNTNGNVVFNGNMSGAHGFTTQGGKTTILNGTNTFTGNLFVSNGILQLGYGGTTGTIAAHVLLNGGDATFVVNRSDTYNLNSKVTQNLGTGGFIQAGSGTTIVSSAITMNQKSGFGVAVQAGTLKVVSGGSVAASTISNSADFIVDVGGAVTADALTNTSKGVLTNSGYYTVTNTTNSGTLTNLNGGTITGNIDNKGTFGNNGTLSGNVVNSGIALNDEKGTLTGNVTNTGNFTNKGYVAGVVSNAFQFTNAKTGTVKGLVTNGYEMRNYGVIETLKLANNGTFVNYEGGVIKGDVVNNGRMFLNSGLIEKGTVYTTTGFSNDKTGIIDGLVTNTGVFGNDGVLKKGFNNTGGMAYLSGQVLGTVNNTGTIAVSNLLTGDGAFNNAKGAVLFVAPDATYTGLTTLSNAGTVDVAATGNLVAKTVSNTGLISNKGTITAGNVYLEKSGVLTGNGTIDGNLTAKSGSIIQPATAVDAPYAQAKITGALLVEKGAAINIRMAADGTGDGISAKTAKLEGGKLNIAMGPGEYTYGQRFTILTTTNGVTGTFSEVAFALKLPTLLVADLQYMKNDVVLRVRTDFQSVALNAVQAAAAKGLDEGSGFASTPETKAFVDAILAQKPADLPKQFEQLSGEGLLSARTANRLAGSSFMGAIAEAGSTMREGGIVSAAPIQVTSYAPYLGASSNPIKVRNPLATSNTIRVWGSFLAGKQNVSADANSGNGAQASRVTGGVVGLDYQVASDWMIGIAGGMSESKFSGEIGKVSGDGKGAHVGVYSTAAGKDYYVQMSSAASFFNNKTERSIIGVGALPDENASASYNSMEWRSRVEVGLDEYVADVKFTPYVAAEAAVTRNPKYAETSKTTTGTPGIMALTFAGDTSLSLPVSLGLKIEKRMEFNGGFSITPTMSVAYVHDFRGQQQQKTSYSVLPGSSFTVLGAKAPDSIQAKLGIQIGLGKHLAIYAQAEGEISRNARAYAGRVGMKGMW